MKKAFVAPLVFFALFWFAFLGLTGTLTSGFHLTDDHQIIGFSETLEDEGVVSAALDWIGKDAGQTGRFLPLYYLHRLVQVKLLGTDFTAWGIYTGAAAALASALLGASLVLWGFALFEALLFPLLLLLGFQSAIWWRFGTAETIGMLILSAMLLAAAAGSRKKSAALDAAFVLAGALLMLAKENFILFIPAALFLKIWMGRGAGSSWTEAIKRQWAPAALLLGLSAAALLFIKFFVGTTGIGYAGYDGFRAGPFISALVNYSFASQAWLAAAAAALAWASLPRGRRLLPEAAPALILLFLSVAPQAALYAKSGVSERYLLPGVFGVAFFAVHMLRVARHGLSDSRPALGPRQAVGWAVAAASFLVGAWMMGSPKLSITFTAENLGLLSEVRQVPALSLATAAFHAASGKAVLWAALAFALVCAVASRSAGLGRFFNQRTALAAAVSWAILFNFSIAFDKGFLNAFQGWTTNEWIASIEGSTSSGDAIVVVADPALNNEWALSLRKYLAIESGRKNLYAYPVLTRPAYTPFEKTLIASFDAAFGGRGLPPDRGSVRAFVIFPGAEDAFIAASSGWFDSASFSRYANEYGFVSYYRAFAPPVSSDGQPS